LLKRGERVIGYDNLDPFYDPRVKRRNLAQLTEHLKFTFIEADIREAEKIIRVVQSQEVDRIVHLAGLANVRASINRAADYTAVNIGGTVNMLEAARAVNVRSTVIASTSSVYGEASRVPFVEDDPADHPLAPYPASKRAAEIMAHSFHHLFQLPISVVRFFSVYGPRGRPDMMPYQITEAIVNQKPITLFNNGAMKRDWTYVEDIARGVIAALDTPQSFGTYNLGRGEPVLMSDFVQILEELIGKEAIINNVPAPATEPSITYANISRAHQAFGYQPQVAVLAGLKNFWEWYRSTHT
jgi:UDP-glucuronate 4-epimerase